MWEDETIDELHRIREEHAKSFNYDLDAMFEDWQKKQAIGDRQIITQSNDSPATDLVLQSKTTKKEMDNPPP